RWFEWACYCPVMRLHGDREPHTPALTPGVPGGGQLGSGGPNEIWSYGEANYQIMKRYIERRAALKPYIERQMRAAHEQGIPVMRPLFYDFPGDGRAWEVEDAYMFGDRLLVAPVMEAGAAERAVYLPAGARWLEQATGTTYDGGREVRAHAPIDVIPVFERLD
ncbi:MAG: family 31 glucosidase, partial [Clostridiales bacterium]|nr:family 31 glucosidase [Clostridiales bacterium]